MKYSKRDVRQCLRQPRFFEVSERECRVAMSSEQAGSEGLVESALRTAKDQHRRMLHTVRARLKNLPKNPRLDTVSGRLVSPTALDQRSTVREPAT